MIDNVLFISKALNNIFLIAIWLPQANFGPLSRGQPDLPNVNHCVLHF